MQNDLEKVLKKAPVVPVLVIDAVENAVRAPLGALFRHGEGWAVYKLVDGRARLTPVVTGIADTSYREITEGLTEGDTVILFPGDSAADPPDIAQFDLHQRTARDLDVAFGHHAAGRKVAHLHRVLGAAGILFDLDLGHDEQAVARQLTGVDVAHSRVLNSSEDSRSRALANKALITRSSAGGETRGMHPPQG